MNFKYSCVWEHSLVLLSALEAGNLPHKAFLTAPYLLHHRIVDPAFCLFLLYLVPSIVTGFPRDTFLATIFLYVVLKRFVRCPNNCREC